MPVIKEDISFAGKVVMGCRRSSHGNLSSSSIRRQHAVVRTETGLRATINMYDVVDGNIDPYFFNLSEYVSVGQNLLAVVVNINKERIQIDLSIKPTFQLSYGCLDMGLPSSVHPSSSGIQLFTIFVPTPTKGFLPSSFIIAFIIVQQQQSSSSTAAAVRKPSTKPPSNNICKLSTVYPLSIQSILVFVVKYQNVETCSTWHDNRCYVSSTLSHSLSLTHTLSLSLGCLCHLHRLHRLCCLRLCLCS